MRSAWTGLAVIPFLLLAATRTSAQQAVQAPANQASDPQAVALVQAAITALGGAAAIGQPQSWTFQAQLSGPFGGDVAGHVISTDTDRSSILHDGTVAQIPMIQSHFAATLVGPILLSESQSPQLTMRYRGTSTIDGKTVTVITFEVGPDLVPVQTWAFDSSNLPVRINFQLPAEIGTRKTVHGTVSLSDYRAVSGVLYPFKGIELSHRGLPEVIAIQSISPSTTAVHTEPDPTAGDSL